MNRNHSNVSAEVGSIERQTAMLVDDDANHRQVLGEALTEDGWDVIEAATGENALMLDVKPALLVTDINLGAGMDGWSLGGLARNRWPDVGLLFISGANQPDRQQHFLLGAFLQKPFLLSDFIAAVSGVARTAAAGASLRQRAALGASGNRPQGGAAMLHRILVGTAAITPEMALIFERLTDIVR
jgi:DNA-binding response OmpR family regulator